MQTFCVNMRKKVLYKKQPEFVNQVMRIIFLIVQLWKKIEKLQKLE